MVELGEATRTRWDRKSAPSGLYLLKETPPADGGSTPDKLFWPEEFLTRDIPDARV
jgi:hypothetical protein